LTRIFLCVTRVTCMPLSLEISHEVSISSLVHDIRYHKSLCCSLFFCSAVGLAAESGVDTVKIESITSLKGVLNEKENTFKVSKAAAINTQPLAANN
jgi:hypothetical protein